MYIYNRKRYYKRFGNCLLSNNYVLCFKVITNRKLVLLNELHLIEMKVLLKRDCSGFSTLLFCFFKKV